VCALVALVSALPDPDSANVINQNLVNKINADGEWEASLNNKFAEWTVADVKRILGTKLDGKLDADVTVVNTVVGALPAAFDSRTQWPNGQIHPIRDQASCGSCWAFGSTEAFSDRIAIANNNSVNVVLSPQQLVSCDTATGNLGCDGGYPIRAMQYQANPGVVVDACYPYSSGAGVSGTCLWKKGATSCTATKGSGSATVYAAADAYAISSYNAAAMQTDILTYGPIEVQFEVYNDFMSYTSGVYTHKTGAYLGGHAVKAIGWGTLNGVDYWTMANSWGTSWGINGFFLIKRGVDECGIESLPVAGHSKIY